VGLLHSFNGLEVALIGKAGGRLIGGGGGGARAAGGCMKLTPEDLEDGRPPGLDRWEGLLSGV